MTDGRTTAKLSKLTLQGDALIHQGVLTSDTARRLAQFFRKSRMYFELAEELEVACEREKHRTMREYREQHGRDPYRWQDYPKDPILRGELPSEVFGDVDFDPMCEYCRDRYKL